jgi:hypothetical protein
MNFITSVLTGFLLIVVGSLFSGCGGSGGGSDEEATATPDPIVIPTSPGCGDIIFNLQEDNSTTENPPAEASSSSSDQTESTATDSLISQGFRIDRIERTKDTITFVGCGGVLQDDHSTNVSTQR